MGDEYESLNSFLGPDDLFPYARVTTKGNGRVDSKYLKKSNMLSFPNGIHFETTDVTPTPVANWGQKITAQLPQINAYLHGASVVLGVSAFTASGTSNTYCRTAPVHQWIPRIDIMAAGSSVPTQTITGTLMSVHRYLHTDGDELERFRTENCLSDTDRASLAASAQVFICNFPSLFDASPLLLALFSPNSWRYEINLAPITDVVQADGTGLTITGSITYCSVRLHTTTVTQAFVDVKLKEYREAPHIAKFLDYRYAAPKQIVAGSTQVNNQLTGVSGKVSHITVLNRLDSDSTTSYQKKIDNYQSITGSFKIIDSKNANLVGNMDIGDVYCRYLLMEKWFTNGAFTKIPNIGSGSVAIKEPKIYAYSYNDNPERTFSTGVNGGYRKFNGTEQLVTTFSSATGANMTQDVIAYVYSYLKIDEKGNVSKVDA